jgi:hypothetical protein
VNAEERAEVAAYARQLAEEAPALTPEQTTLLLSLLRRYPRQDGTVFAAASAAKG